MSKKLIIQSQVTGERIHLHLQTNGRLLVTLDDVTFPVEIRMEAVKGAKVGAVPRIWVPGLDDRKPVAAPAPAPAPVVAPAPVEAPAAVEASAEKPAESVVSDTATRRKRRGTTSEEQAPVTVTSEEALPEQSAEVRGEP